MRIADVSKTYGHTRNAVLALDRVTLTVDAGEFVCVLGASGCGKTTLLNLVAGLELPTKGSIDVTGEGRPGLMFQESALFPWLTAAGNVELPLRLRGMPRQQRRSRALELLSQVHLAGFEHKRPHELSGGMRQRVALARSLAQDTDVLLLDEPFGALDAITRDVLHEELESVWEERSFGALFVTHNVREAVRLGDRVVVLSSRPGRVVQEFRIDLPRPRRADLPAVAEATAAITERLRQEVRRHGR